MIRPPPEWSLEEARDRRVGICTNALDGEPVSDLVVVYSQLRLLVAAGVPANYEKGNPRYQQWGKLRVPGAKATVPLYVLKPKTHHWRLYFVAFPDTRRIILLYAVKKKENPRNPADRERCQLIFDRLVLRDKRTDTVIFHVPPA